MSQRQAPRPLHFSLRFLLLSLTGGVLIGALLVVGLLVTRAWTATLHTELEAKGASLARTLAAHAEYGVLVGDSEGLDRLINGLRHDEDVVWAQVSDQTATILAEGPRAEPAPEGGAADEQPVELPLTSEARQRVQAPEGVISNVHLLETEGATAVRVDALTGAEGVHRRFTVPVTTLPQARSREELTLSIKTRQAGAAQLEQVGTVTLYLSEQRIEGALADVRLAMLWIATWAVGAGLLLAAPLAQALLSPVQGLVLASQRIATGDRAVSLAPSRVRELSELSGAFQQMLVALNERDQQLLEDVAELERRADFLKQRQSALESANEALVRLNTELRLSQEQLQTSNTELVRASGLKSAFLANMSHELRTPLNSIIGYTECLVDELDGPINGEQRDSLERVLRNGRQLLALINEVLDLSRIEAGRMALSLGPVHPGAVAEECLAILRPLVRGRPVELRAELATPLPVMHGDEQRVRQVLMNLLSNGVKFTEVGEVVIAVREDGDGVLLSVRDTGRGIPPERLDEIFLEFHRLDESLTVGTGLGLAITRALVELMSGKIRVESRVGEGSVFTVWLPLRAGELPTAPLST